MDIFLIFMAIFGFVVTVGIAFYLVVLYQSEDDKNQAWFPKGVVVAGLSFSVFAVLLLPFDVANRRDVTEMDGDSGGLDVEVMWEMVLWIIAIWLLLVTPFATFYYESWDPTSTSIWDQIRPAACYTTVTLVVFSLFFTVFYLTIGMVDLPFDGLTSPPTKWDLDRPTIKPWKDTRCFCNFDYNSCVVGNKEGVECTSESGTLTVRVSAFLYIIGLICALGWFTFVVFGGAGIVALPMDLINEWRTKPERISRKEYTTRKAALAREV